MPDTLPMNAAHLREGRPHEVHEVLDEERTAREDAV